MPGITILFEDEAVHRRLLDIQHLKGEQRGIRKVTQATAIKEMILDFPLETAREALRAQQALEAQTA